jgi:hypothetical protein
MQDKARSLHSPPLSYDVTKIVILNVLSRQYAFSYILWM